MRKAVFSAVILAALSTSSGAVDAPASGVPKGTICYGSNGLRTADAQPITCKGLGRFTSVADIYERGYRVVTSGVLPEAGGTVFLIIELRS